jgi:alanine racemase
LAQAPAGILKANTLFLLRELNSTIGKQKPPVISRGLFIFVVLRYNSFIMTTSKYRTWIEISESAIKNNYQIFRRMLKPGIKMLGVVKSNAYGHGLFGFAKVLADLGIDWLGVDSITEAETLRERGIKVPILVLGYTLPANFGLAHSYNVALTVSSFDNLKIANKLGKKINIHLKIDTGMHRQGFQLNDLQKALAIIKDSKFINLQGIYTHFAAAKNPDWSGMTGKQIALFNQAVKLAKSLNPGIIAHASASAGALNFDTTHYDMVRIGAALYGLWPSLETKLSLEKKINLKPVLTWKTLISEVKTIEKGEKIGYDFTEEIKRKSKIAVLPIGYWHGYWRALSGAFYVLLRGQKAKVLGRVSMDMVTIDVTGIKGAKVGDVVVLLGKQGKDEISADDMAKVANTTNYEIVTRINPLIKKYYC